MRKSKTKKLAKDKADRYYSEYVRRSNSDSNGLTKCVTCGKVSHWKNMHTGHFMSRRYESTRYDERNTGVQCVSCNTFHQGRQFRFAQHIDKKHGEGTAEQLEMKSKMLCKRNQFDYEYIAKEYKDKIKSLKT